MSYETKFDPRYPKETKGKLGGKCNRTACAKGPAMWFSPVEQAHYCEECAIEINKWTTPQVKKMYKVETFA